MKTFLLLSIYLFLLNDFTAIRAHPTPPVLVVATDSVGVEKKGGKRYILHRVDEGQTLYAIARRYGRSVADIKAANPDMNESVRYDQLVRIPIPDGALSKKEEKAIDKAIRKEEKEQKREAKIDGKTASTETKSTARNEKDAKKGDDPAKAGIHVVEPGQTLYSLAIRYGVPQSDLRKWNSLSNDNVLIGQALIVSEKAYVARSPTPTAPAKTPDAPVKTSPARSAEPRPAPTPPRKSEESPEPKPERPASGSDNRRPDTPPPTTDGSTVAGNKPAEVIIEPPRAGNDAPMPIRGRRISDSGVAEMIDGTDGSGKYLALHRTAPIGTLVQVRNEFNNQSVWVKVVGRLPNTGVNDKILIKLSTQAFAKLSPEDRRFRAEVSYIVR